MAIAQVGNCIVQTIEDLLRQHSTIIQKFEKDARKSCLGVAVISDSETKQVIGSEGDIALSVKLKWA